MVFRVSYTTPAGRKKAVVMFAETFEKCYELAEKIYGSNLVSIAYEAAMQSLVH